MLRHHLPTLRLRLRHRRRPPASTLRSAPSARFGASPSPSASAPSPHLRHPRLPNVYKHVTPRN
ncbi:MAG: hypothetical protein BJ554DRAFT_5593 [Olpidium bornovanus]|uniref:Uncharacterized protein n=1 Tax=Olpidium bornovanus TaxID=278681 RepID=A0A8H8DKW4_9FUNG|nr:MAG: hypothetical protein BJ554DRAFT_5593 [Olpidium bornovanus]